MPMPIPPKGFICPWKRSKYSTSSASTFANISPSCALSPALISALCVNNSETVRELPLMAAWYSGVNRSPSGRLARVASCSSIQLTRPTWPLVHARWIAVWPSVLSCFRSAPASINGLTKPARPWITARCSGVLPLASGAVVVCPWPSSHSMVSVWPAAQARCSGPWPSAVFVSSLSPSATSFFSNSTWPPAAAA